MPDSPDEVPILRILDANRNRATEALRVVEEYLRFRLDDPHLTGLCKQLRHDLTAAASTLDGLHAARETRADVGTAITTEAEYDRADLAAIVSANQKRAEQALRVLEEYAKPICQAAAACFEQLRYRAYTLGKAVQATVTGRERLGSARLYVLVDAGCSLPEFQARIGPLVEAKADVIQLRDKRCSDRELIERARSLRELTRGSTTTFIVNDRPDVAVLVEADGVHVGQDELTVKDCRRIMGPQPLVGVSTHSIEQARQAVLDGADYIGCGPVFPSRTKEFQEFSGLDLLRAVAGEISLPAFAIGGISGGNLSEVLAAGFRRVAVGSAITAAPVPWKVARRMSEALAAAPDSRTGD